MADLTGVDWKTVFAQAVAIASAVTRGSDVLDVVQEGIRLVLEGDEPWDPASGKALPQHVAEVGVRARGNRLRSDRRRQGPKMVGKLVVALDVPPPTPEESFDGAEGKARKARRFAQLVAVFANDEVESAVLRLLEEGVTAVDEQVEKSGYDDRRIANARRRISRHAQSLVRREEREEIEVEEAS